MCLAMSNNLLLVLYDAPKRIFSTNSWSSGQLKNDAKTFFFPTLHPLSLVIFATATVVAFVLLCNSRFNFHCYTQCKAMPTQKLARKWCCDLSWLLVWKITKVIHSCKSASLNHPIMMITTVNLNTDKFIETLDITNMHGLGKIKQEEKSKIPIYS